MNIENLTQLEKSIEIRMPNGGHFEERDEYLLSYGLYNDWSDVFIKYVNLALSGNLEALKRSLFFLWYQCSEPDQLSGIRELDEDMTNKILIKIDSMAEADELDAELTFMLPFYYQVAEWYFERFNDLDNVRKASISNSDLWEKEAVKVNWKNRGIMGEYWISQGL